ncbi:YggT family protein [Patescibacteria group bacterium]|nr:YggT family protein [Patescibacteria group bacterium]
MTETKVRKTVTTKRLGNTDVYQEDVSASEEVEAEQFALAKVSQFLWFIGHLIATLLVLRFIFLILGANLTGIVRFIYNITNVLVIPFRGIFPNIREGVSYFDTAALLGIVMYYLIILLIDRLILLFSKSTEPME